MHHWLKKLGVAALLTGTLVMPALAGDLTPVGSWQDSKGETRVRVTLCGDGTDLCAKLTWLSEKAKTPENLQYLNAYVVQGAEQTRENAWKGEVHFNGQTANGTIKLTGQNSIELSGCKMGLCQSIKFKRI